MNIRLLEALALVVGVVGSTLLGFWMGIGAGVNECAAHSERGYRHAFMAPGTHVKCEIVKEQQ